MSDGANPFVSFCGECQNAVKERVPIERGRFEEVWNRSIGAVERAKKIVGLKREQCCCCAGHPDKLCGFAEESHLGSLLEAA